VTYGTSAAITYLCVA